MTIAVASLEQPLQCQRQAGTPSPLYNLPWRGSRCSEMGEDRETKVTMVPWQQALAEAHPRFSNHGSQWDPSVCRQRPHLPTWVVAQEAEADALEQGGGGAYRCCSLEI